MKLRGRALSSRDLNVARGIAMTKHHPDSQVMSVFEYIDFLESVLDTLDEEDAFGTEGWRHHVDHPDAR